MSMAMARRASSARATLGRLFHWHSQGGRVGVEGPEAESDLTAPWSSDLSRPTEQEPVASARGVIRRQEVPLLSHYGTSYGLFDAWIADYECVLISDVYELGYYVGDSVWVSGPLTRIIGEMPVMKVTRMELLRLKWMR